jgi:hypothetical protein
VHAARQTAVSPIIKDAMDRISTFFPIRLPRG